MPYSLPKHLANGVDKGLLSCSQAPVWELNFPSKAPALIYNPTSSKESIDNH